jgi:hypothetical protein
VSPKEEDFEFWEHRLLLWKNGELSKENAKKHVAQIFAMVKEHLKDLPKEYDRKDARRYLDVLSGRWMVSDNEGLFARQLEISDRGAPYEFGVFGDTLSQTRSGSYINVEGTNDIDVSVRAFAGMTIVLTDDSGDRVEAVFEVVQKHNKICARAYVPVVKPNTDYTISVSSSVRLVDARGRKGGKTASSSGIMGGSSDTEVSRVQVVHGPDAVGGVSLQSIGSGSIVPFSGAVTMPKGFDPAKLDGFAVMSLSDIQEKPVKDLV